MVNTILLAQSSAQKAVKTSTTTKPAHKPAPVANNQSQDIPLLLIGGGVMVVVVIGAVVYAKLLVQQIEKKLKFEKFRTKELEKKLKLALETIRKMETNPDLVHSRDFNLDYLRMRMSEEVFHFALVNQIKIKVKDKISQALRPSQSQQGSVGVASMGRQVDETFDVEYETGVPPNIVKRILFRVQIRLVKLPTQATSATISQIIDCIETYLSPRDEDDTWQPTIQGRIVYMHWDQKAKPTPLLVLEQSNEGVNVTFRTSRQGSVPAASEDNDLDSTENPTNHTGQSKPAAPAAPPKSTTSKPAPPKPAAPAAPPKSTTSKPAAPAAPPKSTTSKPAASQPAQPKPAQPKPAASQPAQPKPATSQPAQPKSTTPKPVQPKTSPNK